MSAVISKLSIRKLLLHTATRAFSCAIVPCLTVCHAADFIPLGIPIPAVESSTHDISDNGQVISGGLDGAVQGEALPQGNVHRWTIMEGFTGLRPGEFGGITQLSPDGSTAVWRRDGETHIWSEGSELISLPAFTNGDGEIDMSMNGSVVVGRTDTIWSRDHGLETLSFGASHTTADGTMVFGTHSSGVFRWTRETGATALGSVPGDNTHEILGTSIDGATVMGLSSFFRPGGAATPNRLWRWTPDSGLVVEDELSARRMSGRPLFGSPTLMSVDGTSLIVNSRKLDGSGAGAYRWTEESGLLAIPGLLGYAEHLVLEMSNDGAVILGVSFNSSVDELWLWTERLGVRSLYDVLVAQGVAPNDLAAWDFVHSAGGITSSWALAGNGRAVAGSGKNPDGNLEAWVAYFDPFVIPEPSSLLLSALALAGIVARHGGERYRSARLVKGYRLPCPRNPLLHRHRR